MKENFKQEGVENDKANYVQQLENKIEEFQKMTMGFQNGLS